MQLRIKVIIGFTAKYHTFWRFTALLLTEFLRWLKWPKNPKKDDGKPKGFSWFSTIAKNKRNRQFKNHSEYFLTGAQKRSTDEIYIFLWSSILAPNCPALTHLPSLPYSFFEQTSYFKASRGDGFCVVLLSFHYFKLELEFGMFLNNIMDYSGAQWGVSKLEPSLKFHLKDPP